MRRSYIGIMAVLAGLITYGVIEQRKSQREQAMLREQLSAMQQKLETLRPDRRPPRRLTAEEESSFRTSYVRQLDGEVSAQTKDGWGSSVEQTLQKDFGSIVPSGSELRDVTCGSTLCRVAVILKDQSDAKKFSPAFSSLRERWRGQIVTVVPRDEAPYHWWAFLAKEGSQIPASQSLKSADRGAAAPAPLAHGENASGSHPVAD